MKNDGTFMTRKETQREEFREHFCATWPPHIRRMTDDQLIAFNAEKLADFNAGWSETMYCLKAWVLQEMAERGL